MTLPLRWTERAVAHLEALVDYISITSPMYAEGVVGRIDAQLQHVRAHPAIGKRVPEASALNVREVIVPPYRVLYRHHANTIEVLAIVHERRLLAHAL